MTILSPSAIYQLALNAGFKGQDATTATAIALAESSGDSAAINRNTNDYGLMQINSSNLSGLGTTSSAMFDPAQNMAAAYQLYQGRGGNFTDWVSYNQGRYQEFLPQAQNASALGIDPSSVGTGSGSSDYFANNSAPYSQQAPSVLGASASEDASGGNLQGTFGLSGPQSTSIDPSTGDSTDQPVNLSNTWDGGLSGIPSAQTGDLPSGSSAGQVVQVGTQGTGLPFASDTSSGGDAAGGGGGFPIQITNASQIGTQAASTLSTAATGAANTVGKAVQSGSSQVSSALTNSTQAGIQGLTNLVGSSEQAGTDWLIRGALILAGIVLAYGAFTLMSKTDAKFA